MRFSFFRLLLLFLVAKSSFGQEKLRGFVFGETATNSKIPLPLAHVFWLNSQIGVYTNEKGYFEIDKVDSYNQLVISYVGYKPDTLNIGNNDEISVVLTEIIAQGVEIIERQVSQRINPLGAPKTIELNEKTLRKAACCNLSESFENTPSVDVSFTDAVTGTRQIQMLGLAGKYSLTSQELLPKLRGLNVNQGLSFIPGPWVKSIQVTKGVGPVTNGFESISGQINVELKKPEDSEKLFLNMYYNNNGRTELNFNTKYEINKKWSSALLLHGSIRPVAMDQNNDTFLDNPTGQQINVLNRWKYQGEKGLEAMAGIQFLIDEKQSGQLDFKKSERNTFQKYGIGIDSKYANVWTKIGYVFPNKDRQSIGLQISTSRYEQNSFFGKNDYDASQNSLFANLIFQTANITESQTLRAGLSLIYDQFSEKVNIENFNRQENVPGIFTEYTFKPSTKFLASLGARLDNHSIFGTYFTPRIHLKFSPYSRSHIRFSAGQGRQTANVFSDNLSVFASSRQIGIMANKTLPAYGLKQEIAWNYGLNFSQNFTLDYREGSFTIEYYRTDFVNQVVVDYDFAPNTLLIYNLNGKSYSNSFQTELSYEIIRRFDLSLAYRYLDVKTEYLKNGLLEKALVPPHRAFINLAYETKSKLMFDFTAQWFSSRRLPKTDLNPIEHQLPTYSPSYFYLHSQISKSFKKGLEIYLGIENMADFRQNDPILDSNNPYGLYFDSSMTWGPIFGRMYYLGFRYTLK